MASHSNTFLIGSYISITANKFYQAILDTIKIGGNCCMFYTGSPQSTKRDEIPDLQIEMFKNTIVENKFNIDNICVHTPYIINIASSDNNIVNKTIKILNNEIDRCEKLSINKLIVHCGNATNNISISHAIQNCANVINIVNKNNNKVVICLETMSGKGTEIGSNFEEIKEIIDKVENKKLIGVCIDTCHINDAGYNLAYSKSILDKFEKIIGLEYLRVIHLNDSENFVNNKKDRHANLGYGKIGFDNLLKFVYDERVINIPKILETPIIDSYIYTYKNEIKNIINSKFIDWKNS